MRLFVLIYAFMFLIVIYNLVWVLCVSVRFTILLVVELIDRSYKR